MVEALRTDYSVRQIRDTLSFNRSSLYYQPKSDTSDEVLQDEILRLSVYYPKYGYRRITKLLLCTAMFQTDNLSSQIGQLTYFFSISKISVN